MFFYHILLHLVSNSEGLAKRFYRHKNLPVFLWAMKFYFVDDNLIFHNEQYLVVNSYFAQFLLQLPTRLRQFYIGKG